MHPQRVIERVRDPATGGFPPVGPAEGEIVLGAVLLEIQKGLTTHITRLS
jgi:hypothetical protein